MKLIKIYALSTEEEPNDIRYIGQTNKELKARLARHISKYELKAKTYKNSWLKSILNKGHTPKITLLEEVSHYEWEFWEMYWIEQFKWWGFKLTNQTLGGSGFPPGKLNASLIKNNKNNYISREKPVSMYSKDGKLLETFPSIREAERATKINKAHIWGCCNGTSEHNTAGGYVFVYFGQPFILRKNKVADNRKPIIQKDKLGNVVAEYNSALEAANTLKINHSSIAKCARKCANSKTAGGFVWEYK